MVDPDNVNVPPKISYEDYDYDATQFAQIGAEVVEWFAGFVAIVIAVGALITWLSK